MSKDTKPSAKPPAEDEVLRRFGQTYGVTQSLERDIIEFLSSKHTQNAMLTVQEIMKLYGCPEDRARRVIANLVRDKVLVAAGKDVYKVDV